MLTYYWTARNLCCELVLLNNLWIDYEYREWKMVWPASKYFPCILREYLRKPWKISHDSRKYWTRNSGEGTKRLYACELSLSCFYYEHLIQYNWRQRKFPIVWNFMSLNLMGFMFKYHLRRRKTCGRQSSLFGQNFLVADWILTVPSQLSYWCSLG
jgi:hypothetical protein